MSPFAIAMRISSVDMNRRSSFFRIFLEMISLEDVFTSYLGTDLRISFINELNGSFDFLISLCRCTAAEFIGRTKRMYLYYTMVPRVSNPKRLPPEERPQETAPLRSIYILRVRRRRPPPISSSSMASSNPNS